MLYLSLLQRGPQTPTTLAKATGINRSKIYREVEELKVNGLIETVGDGSGKRLAAAPPERLNALVAKKEADVLATKEVVPQLITELGALSHHTHGQFEVKHYDGVEGIKQMLWNELQAEEVLVMGHETMNHYVGFHFAEKQREEVMERDIQYKEIINRSDGTKVGEEYTKHARWKEFHTTRLIDDEILKIRHGIQIYNDTYSVFTWKDDTYAGVEIVNPALADMQRQIFWHFWELAEERV